MNKENDCNFQYFNLNNKWMLLGYLEYCDKQNILQSRKVERKRFKEYLNYIIQNIPTKKNKASKAKLKLSSHDNQRKEDIEDFWKRIIGLRPSSSSTSQNQASSIKENGKCKHRDVDYVHGVVTTGEKWFFTVVTTDNEIGAVHTPIILHLSDKNIPDDVLKVDVRFL
ncbi:11199_t:CDS:2, partial [Dentiscutata erythropus]